jgi:hypothetical protein
MKYKCLKCNKEFSQKSNYDAHNNRKIPCVDLNEVIISSANLPPNPAILPQNTANLTPNSTNILLTNLIDTN